MSSTIYKDKNSVTTLLAIENQLQSCLGIKLNYRPDTTLNAKYGVIPDTQLKDYPRIRYFGIGIRGYANLTSDTNISQPYNPKPTNCDLYEPIPFRCVQVPLEPDEAAKYRMVTRVTINGQTYYQYWLKVIEFASDAVRWTKVDQQGERTYTFDGGSNLNPTPTDLYPTDIEQVEGRIVTSVTGICQVTGAEVNEVFNVMYNGDPRRAVISEFGTYSGFDVEDNRDYNTAGVEAAYVQLATHRCTTGQPMADVSTRFTERMVFEGGSCVII